jgi:predicted  nucleic acid-binding Zn-ribbon protein
VLEERDTWRFRVELAPKSSVELPVTQRLALMEAWVLSSLTAANLRAFEKQGLLDATSRAGLERILALRARIQALEERSAAAEREAAEIAADQGRLRENVKAVGDRRDARELVTRWLGRAGAQETRIEALREERRQSETEREALREEVDGVVRGLEGERRL